VLSEIRAALAFLSLTMAWNPPAWAQDPAPVPQVTVEAQRDVAKFRHDVDAFASSAITKSFGESYMRWDHAVCPLVAGLKREEGEFVLHRLSDIARSAHAPLGKEDCKPNFFVIVTRNPSTFIKLLWRRKPGIFDTRNGIAPVKRFVDLPRPIRVWYNAANIDAQSGAAFTDALAQTAGMGMGTVDYPVHVTPSLGSRLTTSVVRNIDSAIVIVDPEKVQALNIGQIVDYVALVGFAQVNLDKDPAQGPSILKVFSSDDSPPPEMTVWDRALLHALYTTPQRDLMQLSEIETVMVRDLSAQTVK
jgi:hypothetical protein